MNGLAGKPRVDLVERKNLLMTLLSSGGKELSLLNWVVAEMKSFSWVGAKNEDPGYGKRAEEFREKTAPL